MENYLESRRTRRNFSDKEVSTEMLREIVGEAMRARPTPAICRPTSVVYSRKGEARKALEALHFNQPASTGADTCCSLSVPISTISQDGVASATLIPVTTTFFHLPRP